MTDGSPAEACRRHYDDAREHYLREDFTGSEALVAEIRRKLGAGRNAEERRLLSLAHELTARIQLDLGRAQPALEAFVRAEAAAGQDDENRPLLGRIQFQIAGWYSELDLFDEAKRYLDRARENVGDSEYAPHMRVADRHWVEDDGLEWTVRAARLRADLATANRELDAATSDDRTRDVDQIDAKTRDILALEYELAAVVIDNGTDEEAEDSLLRMVSMGVALADTDAESFLDYTEPLTILRDRPGIDFTYCLESLVDTANQVAGRTGSPEQRANAAFIATLLAYQQGDLRAARESALKSVVLTELSLLENHSVLVRKLRGQVLADRREFALAISVERADAETAAELLEGQRLQALPAALGAVAALGERYGPHGSVLGSKAVLGELADVSVGGSSRLAALRAPAAGRPVALEAVIEAVGGPAAWWWGSWISRWWLHWAVRSPGGTWTCGSYRLQDGDIEAIDRFERAYVDTEAAAISAYCLHPATETELAWSLGSWLVPPVLRSALLAAKTPVSLVVAGNLASVLALPALVLEENRGTRLVEFADIRTQPPATLVTQVQRRPVPGAGHWPPLISCVNPTGDLKYAAHADLTTGTVLNQATADDLRDALAKIEPQQPGIFFYSGHVSPGKVPGGLEMALVLDGLEWLTAAEWFGVTERPQLPAPSRALFSACDSSGAAGAGGGEWLGFGAALLSAGARQVVGTAWPIPDRPYTAWFERRLLERMQHEEDVAAALSALQREAARRWRSGDAEAWPMIWASYQSIGVLS